MHRRPSKGKGKRLPSPESTSDEDDNAASQNVKKPRHGSPERIKALALAKAGNAVASSSKGMAGFASLVNRSLMAAKSETNKGLKGSISGRISRTGVNSKAALKADVEGILVGTIVFLVVGIMENNVDNVADPSVFHPLYALCSDVDTSIGALTGMKQAGLCVMRDTGFEFLSTDTFSMVDTKLQSLFPKLYEYFIDQEATETSSSWLICMKLPHRQGIVVYSDDQDLPNGFDIMRACIMSKTKAGPQERILYLVTRNPVPRDVIRSWRPKAALRKVTASGSFEANGLDIESDSGTASSDDPPPLPSAFPLCRSLRNRNKNEEAEVAREVISIHDDDSDHAEVAAGSTTIPATDPVTPPYVASVNDAFSSSMNFGDNPWN